MALLFDDEGLLELRKSIENGIISGKCSRKDLLGFDSLSEIGSFEAKSEFSKNYIYPKNSNLKPSSSETK